MKNLILFILLMSPYCAYVEKEVVILGKDGSTNSCLSLKTLDTEDYYRECDVNIGGQISDTITVVFYYRQGFLQDIDPYYPKLEDE